MQFEVILNDFVCNVATWDDVGLMSDAVAWDVGWCARKNAEKNAGKNAKKNAEKSPETNANCLGISDNVDRDVVENAAKNDAEGLKISKNADENVVEGFGISENAAKNAAKGAKANASRNAGNLRISEDAEEDVNRNVEKDVNKNAERDAEDAAFDNLIRYAFITFLIASRLAKNSWRRFANDADFHAFESVLNSMKNSHLIWFDVNSSPSWWHRRISSSIQSVQPCNVLYSASAIEFPFFTHTSCCRSTVRNFWIVTIETRLKSSSVKLSKSSRNSSHNSMFLQSNISHSSIFVAMNSKMTVSIFFMMTQAGRQMLAYKAADRQGEKDD